MKKEVEEALKEIRPYLQADGGDVEIVDIDEKTGTVKVKLVGHCAGCPFSQMTLQMGIEETLKRVPGVKKVESISSE